MGGQRRDRKERLYDPVAVLALAVGRSTGTLDVYYGTTTLATGFTEAALRHWIPRLTRVALFFIPRANPDIEKFYPLVKTWALEFSDDGWPRREIGLDLDGVPLFKTPNDRNTGFWTDMASRRFDRAEVAEISGAEFERLWSTAPIAVRVA